MPAIRTRRTLLAGVAGTGLAAFAGCTSGDDDDDPNGDDNGDDTGDDSTGNGNGEEIAYEIWALDQGKDNIHVYEPDGNGGFGLLKEIDVNAHDGVPNEGVLPHMIDFSSDYEYAAIACTSGARVLVYRVEDHELVGNIETGPSTHMASFSPGDEYLHVDVMSADVAEIVRVEADLENEEFDIVDEIAVHDDEIVQNAGIDSGAPVCHQYDHSGRSLHTLGPAHGDGALVIVDHDEFEVVEAYSHDELPTNCGTMPHPTEDKFYLTAGLPTPTDEEGEPTGEDGVGEYYVYDSAEDEILTPDGVSTEGIDAHGFWFTPDHEELWVLNRETNDGVIVDPETDEVIEEIDAFGEHQSENPDERDSPDIMWASPDGEYMFVSLRGLNPVSGDPHAATGVTPGFSVLEIESREIVDVVEPDPIDDYDLDEDDRTPDFHGIGVAVTGDAANTSPPY